MANTSAFSFGHKGFRIDVRILANRNYEIEKIEYKCIKLSDEREYFIKGTPYKLDPMEYAKKFIDDHFLKSELEFIDLIDENGRTSHLTINGKLDGKEWLGVGGGLRHGLQFKPKDVAAAKKLKQWLTAWIKENK